MRSASSDDLTARSRIRDAAIARFGSDGFAATSVRTIAADAGVSAALILHHFDSKEGLREACDQHVVDVLLGDGAEIVGAESRSATALVQAALDDLPAYAPLLDYLSRMFLEDSGHADHLFDALLDGTRSMLAEQDAAGLLSPQSDPAVTAAYLTVFGLGPVLMRRQFARALGETDLSPALWQRSTIPLLELFTHGLYTDTTLLDAARDALGGDVTGTPDSPGPDSPDSPGPDSPDSPGKEHA